MTLPETQKTGSVPITDSRSGVQIPRKDGRLLSRAIEPLESRIAPAASGLVTIADLRGESNAMEIRGINPGDEFGFSSSGIGDINGDGFDDFIVSAHKAVPNIVFNYQADDQIGVSYVVFGRSNLAPNLLPSSFPLSSLNGSNGFQIHGAQLYSGAGRLTSSAGDVNGDGFDDLLVGDARGSVFVIFGKSGGFSSSINVSTLNGTNGFTILRSQEPQAVRAIAGAGDFNGDGFDDILIGGSDKGAVIFGKATGFASLLQLSALSAANGFEITGESGSGFGRAASSAGDLNGDGFDDIILGAPIEFGVGAAYVLFGRSSNPASAIHASTLSGSTGFKLRGSNGDYLAATVASGDINGDGVSDIVVSSRRAPGQSPQALAYIIYGMTGNSAFPTITSAINGTNGFRVTDFVSGDLVLSSGTGDINGDGYDDLLLTHAGTTAPARNVSVVFGASSFPAEFPLSTLNGYNGFQIGTQARNGNPSDFNSMGDINNDGFEDFFLGDPTSNVNGTRSGNGHLIMGRSSPVGLSVGDVVITEGNAGSTNATFTVTLLGSTTQSVSVSIDLKPGNATLGDYGNASVASLTFAPGEKVKQFTVPINGDVDIEGDEVFSVELNNAVNAEILDGIGNATIVSDEAFGPFHDLTALNGVNGVTISTLEPANLGTAFGDSMSSSGDINGDGINDIVIGARGSSKTGSPNSGAVYVVFGTSTGLPSQIPVSALNGTNGFQIVGGFQADNAGASVDFAGDVNGDGFDDLLIGAPGSDASATNAGSVYVLFGKSTSFQSRLDLSQFNGSQGFRIDGRTSSDGLGNVSSAGDMNGDGFDDILLGTQYSNRSGTASGAAYVFYGKSGGFTTPINVSDLNGSNGFSIVGDNQTKYLGQTVSDAGDVNGDGFADIVVGAGRFIGTGPTPAAAYVIFGKAGRRDAETSIASISESTGFRVATGSNETFRLNIAGGADFNRDGLSDILFGAEDLGGSAYVLYGSASLGAPVSLTALNGVNGVRIDGSEASFGHSVAFAGDINNDGFEDVVISAKTATDAAPYPVTSYVIFGRSSISGSVIEVAALASDEFVRFTGATSVASASLLRPLGDVNGDKIDDLLISSSNSQAYVVYGRGAATFLDVSDARMKEGDTDTQFLEFTVRLSQEATAMVTVNYSTQGITASSNDYTEFDNASITFAIGETEKTIAIPIKGDLAMEPRESLFVRLSGATGALVRDGYGLGIIENDDLAKISIADMSITEGTGQLTTLEFPITLSSPSLESVFVVANISNTSTASADFINLQTTSVIEFLPGETMKTLSVQVNSDNISEINESFLVSLAQPINGIIDDGQAIGVILNDDVSHISISDVTLQEGSTGAKAFVFTVSLSSPSVGLVPFQLQTEDGTAKVNKDFHPLSGNEIFIPAGALSVNVSVSVIGDTQFEEDETFKVRIVHAKFVSIVDAEGQGTIINDDVAPMQLPLDNRTPVHFQDSNGDNVTLKLTGPGSGFVTLVNGGLNNSDISSISLVDTDTKKTSLDLTVKGTPTSGDRSTSVKSIEIAGGLKALNARMADLNGVGISSTDSIGSLKIRDIVFADITMGGNSTSKSSLQFGRIGSDSIISSNGVFTSISALSIGQSMIQAHGIRRLITTSGPLDADLDVVDAIGSVSVRGGVSGIWNTNSLGLLDVMGGDMGAQINSVADIARVLVRKGDITANITAGGDLGKLEVKDGGVSGHLVAANFGIVSVIGGDLSGSLISVETFSPGLQSLKSLVISNGDLTGSIRLLGHAKSIAIKGAKGSQNGDMDQSFLSVKSIDKFSISGNLVNSRILVGADLGDDLDLGGVDDVFMAGRVGTFKIGGNVLDESIVAIGIDPVNGVFGDGDDITVPGAPSTVKTFTVLGTADMDSYFATSSITRPPKIGGIVIDPASDPRFRVG